MDDISPCLNLGHDEGGYFAVPRLVLSCVDYLGAFYNGYRGRKDRSGRRIFTDGKYSKAVLNDLFGQVDANYRTYSDLLWEIYRNSTIHLHSPKLLKLLLGISTTRNYNFPFVGTIWKNLQSL
jgi:hypothetical protein